MKSLWIVNKVCGALHQKLYDKPSTGGLWLDAMLEEVKQTQDEVIVVNIMESPVLDKLLDGRITYYSLQGHPNDHYSYKSRTTVNQWRMIIEEENPDIIVAWGTEHPYVLAALKAFPKAKILIYAQGILKSIEKYYYSGLSGRQILASFTLRDIIKRETIPQMKKRYAADSLYEREIVKCARGVLIENNWASAYFMSINPSIQTYFSSIVLSDMFCRYSWNLDCINRHTIMCPAADYPIKGLHILLKAIAIVKNLYPDTKVYVPGAVLKRANNIKDKLKQRGYDKLIQKLTDELGLVENIVFLGRLSAEEMARRMSTVNCFVMPSSIENHSSTLKEAMTVGVPCIASYVGGVPEYATHKGNCLMYRFEDYEVLARLIIAIFESDILADTISHKAAEDMRKVKNTNSYMRLQEIMGDIIDEK